MLIPYLKPASAGLTRLGPFRWRGIDDDPHLIFRSGGFLPRFLLLAVVGVEHQVDPCLYFDRGQGFDEEDCLSFGPSGAFVGCVDLRGFPILKRLRFDPATHPDDFRILTIGLTSRTIARALARRLARSLNPRGFARVEFIAGGAGAAGLASGSSPFRSVADHYGQVIALARTSLGPPAPVTGPPLLSFVVPTYDTDPRYLDELLASFDGAPAGMAELVLSDDGSTDARTLAWLGRHSGRAGVRILLHADNRGIAEATNRGVAAAAGPWIGLLDHDDALSVGTVQILARALERNPDAAFVYTDEIVTNASLTPLDYFLKPAFDPVLLSGVNYINHLSLYRADRLRAIGGLRSGYQGSQDYDLLLRYLAGLDPKAILHIPYPAYLWRRDGRSLSVRSRDMALANARRALGERYGQPGRPAVVEPALSPELHRVRLDLEREHWPRVSVIIPSRDRYELISRVLDGLRRTDYRHLEILVIDNGTTDPRVLALYKTFGEEVPGFSALISPEPFNFSRSVNRGVAASSGEVLLLLNNDIEVLEPDWLKEMVACLDYGGTGIVGARLLYSDRTIQHAGVIVGFGGLAGHWFVGKPERFSGPMGRLGVRQSLTAVTGAAMVISRRCFEEVGPFDETDFAIAYNDIDFCLRAGERGYRVVWTPFATLIHHESATRGSDETPENRERFRREQANLRRRHGTATFDDRASNPWYSLDRSVPRLRALHDLPEPR